MEKWFYALFLAASVTGAFALTYKLGTVNGAFVVQAAWDDAEKKRKVAIGKLETEYAVLESTHTTKVKELTDALQRSSTEYETALAGYRADFANRLQLATSRSGVYQRQAQGTAAERDRLAKHASELDRSLEEGRGLVRELRVTLGQRDATIEQLRELILSQQSMLSDPQ